MSFCMRCWLDLEPKEWAKHTAQHQQEDLQMLLDLAISKEETA